MSDDVTPSIEKVLSLTAPIIEHSPTPMADMGSVPGCLGAGVFSAVFKVAVKVGGIPTMRALKINYRTDDCWKWLQFCHAAHKKYKGQPAKLAHLPEVFSLGWRELDGRFNGVSRYYHALMPIYSKVTGTRIGDVLSNMAREWEKKFSESSGVPYVCTDIHDGNWMKCPRRGLMLTDPVTSCDRVINAPLPLFAGRRDLRRRQSFSSAFAV